MSDTMKGQEMGDLLALKKPERKSRLRARLRENWDLLGMIGALVAIGWAAHGLFVAKADAVVVDRKVDTVSSAVSSDEGAINALQTRMGVVEQKVGVVEQKVDDTRLDVYLMREDLRLEHDGSPLPALAGPPSTDMGLPVGLPVGSPTPVKPRARSNP